MDLVGLVEAPDQITAEMWCELLRENGIAASPKVSSGSVYSGAMLGPFSPVGCWVIVREDDVDRAARILEPMLEGKRRHPRRRD